MEAPVQKSPEGPVACGLPRTRGTLYPKPWPSLFVILLPEGLLIWRLSENINLALLPRQNVRAGENLHPM